MMSHKTIGLVTRGLGGLKLRTISRRKYKSWQHSGSYSHISLRDVNLYIWVSWRGGWDLAASKTYLMISRCSTQFRDKAELLSNFPINWPAIMIRPYQSGLLGHDLIPEDIFRIFSCLISEIIRILWISFVFTFILHHLGPDTDQDGIMWGHWIVIGHYLILEREREWTDDAELML